eukprot:2887908-Rhodomonas_salina.3
MRWKRCAFVMWRVVCAMCHVRRGPDGACGATRAPTPGAVCGFAPAVPGPAPDAPAAPCPVLM